jgi:hypothetical protein
MLRLCLTEDSLHNDKLFLLIDFEWCCVLIEPFLILSKTVSEQENSQLRLLFLVVVRRDLIEPKSDGLGVILLALCSNQGAFGCFSQCDDHLIFVLAPLGSVFSAVSVLVSTIIVRFTDSTLEITTIPLFSTTVAALLVWLSLLVVPTLASTLVFLEVSFLEICADLVQRLE